MKRNIQVICIPTETQDEINQESTYAEIMAYVAKSHELDGDETATVFDLGIYFSEQNHDSLGLHWSFLVNTETGEVLNGLYNSQIGAI